MKKYKKIFICLTLFSFLVSCSSENPKEKEKKKEPEINIKIKDLTPPTIILKTSSIDVFVGEAAIDLKEQVIAHYDNYDKKVKLSIKGKADTNKAGSYEVVYELKDKSGNVTRKRLVVNVIEKKKEEIVQKPEHSKTDSSNSTTGGTIVPPFSGGGLPSKSFMFVNGYTMPGAGNSAFDACVQYKGSASGNCNPIFDTDGFTYIGVQYSPY